MTNCPEVGAAQLGFGCVSLTRLPHRGAAERILAAALDHGIRYFDTAPIYGAGYSERILGSAIGNRLDVKIATKVGLGLPPVPRLPITVALIANRVRDVLSGDRRRGAAATATPALPKPRRVTKEEIVRSIEASRLNLRRERIDVLLLHEALPHYLDADALEHLMRLRESGDIGALGVAADGRLYNNLNATDLADWDVLQYQANMSWPGHREARRRFPHQRHVRHSIFRKRSADPLGDASFFETIAHHLIQNGPGYVLFSSTDERHIGLNALAASSSPTASCR